MQARAIGTDCTSAHSTDRIPTHTNRPAHTAADTALHEHISRLEVQVASEVDEISAADAKVPHASSSSVEGMACPNSSRILPKRGRPCHIPTVHAALSHDGADIILIYPFPAYRTAYPLPRSLFHAKQPHVFLTSPFFPFYVAQ